MMRPRLLSGEIFTRQTFPGEVRGTADPSTALRFGRDEKGRVALSDSIGLSTGELQIPPLRYASVGMTKGRVALSDSIGLSTGEPQIPPLRSG